MKLRKFHGRFDAMQDMKTSTGSTKRLGFLRAFDGVLSALFAVLALFAIPALALAGLVILAVTHRHSLALPFILGATGNSSSATTSITSLPDLYEKRNTDLKIAVKLMVEELKWFREYPVENIVVSPNENRVPLLVDKPIAAAAIAEGGKERKMSTPLPTHGTFLPVQLNVRHGFTGLAQALTDRARGAMIQDQTEFQAQMSGYSIARSIGLSTYGQSDGAVAVVKTTGSAGTTQNGIAIKNAYNSSTFVAGGDVGVQDTYLSSLFIGSATASMADTIALVRSGSLVEFGTVTAAPSAGSGVGFIDAVFSSSITPTANDVIYLANADGDNTITGTDKGNWAIGFTEILTASSLLGLATSTKANWAAGSTSTSSQRLTFAVKEKMINECFTASGQTIDRFILPFGVRRDAISAQLGGRRYDGSDTDIEGDLNAGKNQKYYTSPLALPQTLIGWKGMAIGKIELATLPGDDGGTKSQFKLDKIQGVDAIAAAYNYWYQRIPTARSATGYATSLTSA